MACGWIIWRRMVLYPDPSASLLLLIYVMHFRDELVVNMFATSIIRSGYGTMVWYYVFQFQTP